MNNIIPVDNIKEMATNIAKSGLFPDINTPEKAFALMMLCQAEGLHPAMALRKYNIINNRPAMKADAMLAEFNQRGGKCNWKTLTDKEATAEFIHPNGTKVIITWTWEMASKIKYSYSKERKRWTMLTEKHNWQNYPRQMLRARVISEGIRTVMPEACMGVYTPEEVLDIPLEPEQNAQLTPPKPKNKEIPVTQAKETLTEPQEIPQNRTEMAHTAEEEPQAIQDTTISEKMKIKAINARLKELKQQLGESDFNSLLKTMKIDLKKGCSIEEAKKAIALLEQYVINEGEADD